MEAIKFRKNGDSPRITPFDRDFSPSNVLTVSRVLSIAKIAEIRFISFIVTTGFLVACYATLYLAMSVCRWVGGSVTT